MRTFATLVVVCCAACTSLRTEARIASPRERVIVAHRGAHERAPENSLASIREARTLGIDMVELDVRTTADGELVLLHDETVDRTTDGSGRIDAMDAREAQRLILDASDGDFMKETIPTLREALAVAARKGPRIYLHVKDAAPEAIARALEGVPRGRVLVFTEDRDWLLAFHRIAPGRDTLPLAESDPASLEGLVLALGHPRVLAFDEDDFSRAAAKEAHELGVKVIVDVLGDRNVEARVLAAFISGADGVQVDEPTEVLRVLGRELR